MRIIQGIIISYVSVAAFIFSHALSPAVAEAETVPVPPMATSTQAVKVEQRINDLLRIIAELKAEIAALKAANAQGSSAQAPGQQKPMMSDARCAAFERALSARSGQNTDAASGGSVSEVQKFLREQGVFGQEPTGFYGPATEMAVKRFQERHGIISSGTPETTGYGAVGPQTRIAMKRMACIGQKNIEQSKAPPAKETGLRLSLDAVVSSADVSVSSNCPAVSSSAALGSAAAVRLVSDQYTKVDGHDAVVLTYTHPWWFVHPDAKWIWAVDGVSNPGSEEIKTFTRSFEVTAAKGPVALFIAADNAYEVRVNGALAAASVEPNNFDVAHADMIDITGFVSSGKNELAITVTNFAGAPNAQDNPAGLLYELRVGAQEACSPAQKSPGNPGSIKVVSPKTGDEVVIGSTTPVAWTGPTFGTYTIELVNEATGNVRIVKTIVNGARFDWKGGTDQSGAAVPEGAYRMRVYQRETGFRPLLDEMSGAFQVVVSPSIKGPVSGQVLGVSTTDDRLLDTLSLLEESLDDLASALR